MLTPSSKNIEYNENELSDSRMLMLFGFASSARSMRENYKGLGIKKILELEFVGFFFVCLL